MRLLIEEGVDFIENFVKWYKPVISLSYLKTTCLLICLCALSLLLLPLPAQAIPTAQPERIVLTSDLLQERINTPIIREGNFMVDLRKMVIDLRPENTSFQDTFYQVLCKELQKTGTKPLGLDLSHPIVLGSFIGSDLGLRTNTVQLRLKG